ncbi:His-Xaa-Ser system radical SAM maturase HxsB [Candidatus Gracilibacteria bacterium HOT-871]|nr:His-Xaa-Ser system radical SAM maturase HxsB [Candidatus Gracilibacteria bacterium HOT-871]
MLDLEKIKNADTSKIGFFRFKKFDKDTYLITNDVGKYEFLSSKEFEKFISGNVEELEKFYDLKKNGFIKTDDYETKMTGSLALKNHFVGMGPTLHAVIPTLRCNHKCKYCHAAVAPMSAKDMDMTEDIARKVVDTIFFTNSQSFSIEFQGGEALVNYPIIQFVVSYAKLKATHFKKEVNFVLVSNLTLMTEDKLNWLLDNGVDICTSLDGDEITHNGNRIWLEDNSFQKVTYWMRRVDEEKQKRGMGKIGALLTVTKETLPKYKKIIDTYISLGLDSIFLRWLNPYGFAEANLKNLAYKTQDWLDFYKKSLDYIIEINKSGKYFRESITSVYLMKIFNEVDPAFMDIRSPSGLVIGCVAYMYDGKIYTSDEGRMLGRMGIDDFYLTKVSDNPQKTYEEIINNSVTKTVIQASTLDGLPGYNDHVYKPYIGVDVIHNFKTTGSVYQSLLLDEKMKLQIGILDYIFEKLRNPEDKKIILSWIGK